MTDDLDLATAEAMIEKAQHLVGELAAGGQRWKMAIPADVDRDSDFILTTGLTAGRLALAEARRLRESEALDLVLAQRMPNAVHRCEGVYRDADGC